jgi:prevent-host-death family protein
MPTRPESETSIADLRAKLADHLNEVQTRQAVVYVTSRGRRVAAIVPVADAEQIAHSTD